MNEVERRIEEAFSVFPMPAPEEIAEPADGLDAQGLRAGFAGKHWREVPLETLMYWCTGEVTWASSLPKRGSITCRLYSSPRFAPEILIWWMLPSGHSHP